MSIRIEIQGSRVDPKKVSYRQLGFGQETGPDLDKVEILASESVFLELLQDDYDQYLAETRGLWDDNDAEDLLFVAGYPPLREAARDPQLLAFVLQECLAFQFLEHVASSSDPKPGWLVESIVGVSREGEVIKVECMASRQV